MRNCTVLCIVMLTWTEWEVNAIRQIAGQANRSHQGCISSGDLGADSLCLVVLRRLFSLNDSNSQITILIFCRTLRIVLSNLIR